MNDQFISPREAAQLLRVDRLTIYKMIRSGQLDAIRVRRSIRIPVVSLRSLPSYEQSPEEGSRE